MADNNSIGQNYQKLFESNSNLCQLLNVNGCKSIDSKDGLFKEERIFQTEKFQNAHPDLNLGTFKVALRGDLISDDHKIIIDTKSYDKIQPRMKFPKDILESEDYIKGIDSNIRYTFRYLQYNNMGINPEFTEVVNVILDCNVEEIKKYYEQFANPTKIGTISKDTFVDIVNINEIGFAYDEEFFNIKRKMFISKSGSTSYVKEIDLSSVNGDIDLKLYISPIKPYIYLLFYEDEECQYIVSQRKDFKPNCSFINRNLLLNVGTI